MGPFFREVQIRKKKSSLYPYKEHTNLGLKPGVVEIAHLQ